jgi:hypothetical protein
MKPYIWGRAMWSLIVGVVMRYPKYPLADDVTKMHRFLDSLGNVLPCNKCKPNYIRHMSINLPISDYINSRDTLLKWVLGMYNLTLIENNRQPIDMDAFMTKFNTQIEERTIISIKNIVSEYTPTFENMLQYKSFFKNYLMLLNKTCPPDIDYYLYSKEWLTIFLIRENIIDGDKENYMMNGRGIEGFNTSNSGVNPNIANYSVIILWFLALGFKLAK